MTASVEVPAHDEDVPRYQPWLGVAAASFVPCVLLFVLPPAFLVPMIALAAGLLTASIVMLVRQERRDRGARRGETV